MHSYSDGLPMIVGDVIDIPDVGRGRIVAIFENRSFLDGYLESEWRFLSKGVLLELEGMGLVYYESGFDRQWKLVARKMG